MSLVGAGGKTSLMFALALEATRRWGPQRALVTTTTRIYEPGPRDLPPLGRPVARVPARPALRMCLTGSLGDAVAAAGRGELRKTGGGELSKAGRGTRGQGAKPSEGALMVLGTELLPTAPTEGALPGTGRRKVKGVPPDWVGELHRSLPGTLILVEAEGAAGRPLKAPAEHEPALPASTSVVLAVAGVDVVGRPLGPAHVHRPELVAGLTGLRAGDQLRPRDVAVVLRHATGVGAGPPQGADLVCVLNKVDSDPAAAVAREVGSELKTMGLSEVLLTSCLRWPVLVAALSLPATGH